jgi:hypothetical protein
MNNLWTQIIVFFIIGIIFGYIINYLIYRLSESKDKIIFTKGISTDAITFTKDYQEILTIQLGDRSPYLVTHENSFCKVLVSYWTVFDIKRLLESLNDQDYSVWLEYIALDADIQDNSLNNPRIILSKEFIINKHSNALIISTLISKQVEYIHDMFGGEVDHHITIWLSPLKSIN